MIPTSHRGSLDSYSFVNGMLNIGFVTGYIHSKGDDHINVAISNAESKAITVYSRPNEPVPSRFGIGDPIRIKVHVSGRKSPYESASQIIRLEAIEYNMPTILDMPPDKVFDKSLRADQRAFKRPEINPDKLEKVEGQADNEKPEEVRRRFFEGRDDVMPDASNLVRLAGFVQSVMIDRSTKDPRGCLVIHLRQTDDPERVIPIRCYHRLAMAMEDKLRPGSPVGVMGYVATRVAPTAEKEGDGTTRVEKYPYIRSDNPLFVATHKQITHRPDWAKELSEQELVRRRAPSQRQETQTEEQPDFSTIGQE